MQNLKTILRLTSVAALVATGLPALATNGMNMEGYGPISTGMGGASQALDHGTAAMAQNPATLALMPLAQGLTAPSACSAQKSTAASPASAAPTPTAPRTLCRRWAMRAAWAR